MAFSNVEQRLAKVYLDTFPGFHPAEKECGVKEQEVFYDLVKGVYRLAYDEPGLFVPTLHDDDFFTRRYNKKSENKPELYKNMTAFIKAVDGLMEAMFRMGGDRDAVKLSRRGKTVLQKLGIDDSGELPEAWTWMSKRDGANLTAFSKCLFDAEYPYTRDVYAAMLGDADSFRKLEDWLTEHHYTRYQYLDGGFSMDYANPAWDKKPPSGGFLYKIRHTGISVSYDPMMEQPQVLGLCIPGGMKVFLEAFDDMPDKVKEFTVRQTKRCDACDYCIQTDTTGKRPRAFVTVSYDSGKLNLCPLFPGFSNCWPLLNAKLADELIAVLGFMDGFLDKRKK